MVGWAGYNGVLNLTANAEGLFMETLWLFGAGHPRLFIPWHDFREARVVSYFFRRQVNDDQAVDPGFQRLVDEPVDAIDIDRIVVAHHDDGGRLVDLAEIARHRKRLAERMAALERPLAGHLDRGTIGHRV